MTNKPPRDVWLTAPQAAAYLDVEPITLAAWVDKHVVRMWLTGNDDTPDRNRAQRFRLTDLNKAARKRGPGKRDVHPDRVMLRTGQLAQYLQIPHRTLNDHIKSGQLTPTDHSPGQRHAYWTLSDAIELAAHPERTRRA